MVLYCMVYSLLLVMDRRVVGQVLFLELVVNRFSSRNRKIIAARIY
jgi:hypothetical protein